MSTENAAIPPAKAERTREPWRWRCPNGHTSWRRAADGYHCGTGMRHDYSCAHFDDLVDAKEMK